MATNATSSPTGPYPLPVYNYRVDIVENGQTHTVAFSEVSGLSIGYQTITYRESRTDNRAGPRVVIMPGPATSTTLTLKKGVVPADTIAVLYGWISTIGTRDFQKKDVVISLLDETGTPLIGWRVSNAFPTKLDAPTFSASGTDVAVESLELAADGVTITPGQT